MFSIMHTAAIFAAGTPASLFKVKVLNNLIDEFRMHNNESDGFYREINHTPGYSPLLDLITNYTNKASLGKDLAYSIFTTIWHGAVLFSAVNSIRTGENRSILSNTKYFITYFFLSFIIQSINNLIAPTWKHTILGDTIYHTLTHGFNVFFSNTT